MKTDSVPGNAVSYTEQTTARNELRRFAAAPAGASLARAASVLTFPPAGIACGPGLHPRSAGGLPARPSRSADGGRPAYKRHSQSRQMRSAPGWASRFPKASPGRAPPHAASGSSPHLAPQSPLEAPTPSPQQSHRGHTYYAICVVPLRTATTNSRSRLLIY